MLALILSLGAAHAVDHAVLFVGNSYTQFNAPSSIDGNYAQLLAEGMPAWEVQSLRYTRGGATLPRHLADASSGTDLDAYLSDTETWQWDLVVLQDQSQLPGFPQEQAEWIESRDAAVSLAQMIDAAGAEPRLFMTWGYREGATLNAWRFPDYPTMQALLAEGYHAYADAIESAGLPVEVVPVGMAWQHIYDAHTAAGEDPLDSGALFSRLYSGDGSHPSVLGSYMASLVFYAASTGQSPEGLEWAPDGIVDHDRAQMQAAAAAVMADVISGPADTGEASSPSDDTGSDTPGGGGEGGTDSAPPLTDDSKEAGDADKSGCGCATGGVGAGWMGVIALAGLRRRQAR